MKIFGDADIDIAVKSNLQKYQIHFLENFL